MFLYFSFVLDSSPCSLAFSSTPLPSDTDLCRSLRPCARCRTSDTHSLSLFALITGPLFAYDAARSVAGRTRLRPFVFLFSTCSFHRVAYIVSRYLGLSYIYPSPALANARQLWPIVFPLSSFVCAGQLRPSLSHFSRLLIDQPATLSPSSTNTR